MMRSSRVRLRICCVIMFSRSLRSAVTVGRTKSSGTRCGMIRIDVDARYQFGRNMDTTAVADAMTTTGMAMNQRRLHAILAKSSGVYFLPGSIGSPRSVQQGCPETHVRPDALPVDVVRQSGIEQDLLVVEILVVRVVGANAHEAVERRRYRHAPAIGVELAVGAE